MMNFSSNLMCADSSNSTSPGRPSPFSFSCFDQLAKLVSAFRASSSTLIDLQRQGPSQTPLCTMLVITGLTRSVTSRGLTSPPSGADASAPNAASTDQGLTDVATTAEPTPTPKKSRRFICMLPWSPKMCGTLGSYFRP
jgi:hypothetical protein